MILSCGNFRMQTSFDIMSVVASPALIEQSTPEPLDSFPLSGGSSLVYARAVDVDPEIWRAAFAESHKDFEYHRLIEETMTSGFIYRYLVLLDENGEPIALQPLIIVDQDLTATTEIITRAVGFIRKFWPRFLRTRMLLAGCLVGDSKPGVIAPANPRRVSALLAEGLRAWAARE